MLESHLYKPYGQEYSQSGFSTFLKYRFNDRRDEGSGLLRWPLRNFKKESYHWTAFDPVARTAPDALVADGSNFFAYCGYDPVNCVDPMGGWKVPRPIPLPGGGSKEPKRQINMPVGIGEGTPPEMQTNDDEILPPAEGGEGSGAPPPQLPDMRQGDWSGQGSPDRVVSPGPDVATKNEVGGSPIVATVNRLGRIAALASAMPRVDHLHNAMQGLENAAEWVLEGTANITAGFVDFIAFGMTRSARKYFGVNGAVDPNSPGYSGGQITGLAWGVITGTALIGKIAWGIEITINSGSNIFKIISTVQCWGYRIDKAHHGQPWGHTHWWEW